MCDENVLALCVIQSSFSVVTIATHLEELFPYIAPTHIIRAEIVIGWRQFRGKKRKVRRCLLYIRSESIYLHAAIIIIYIFFSFSFSILEKMTQRAEQTTRRKRNRRERVGEKQTVETLVSIGCDRDFITSIDSLLYTRYRSGYVGWKTDSICQGIFVLFCFVLFVFQIQ